jgi:hypothetical protein
MSPLPQTRGNFQLMRTIPTDGQGFDNHACLRIVTLTGSLNGSAACVTTERMDKTIHKYTNFDEMKADEYRYWQRRPMHERLAAVSELTEEGYKLKGFEPDAFRLQRALVHFERASS